MSRKWSVWRRTWRFLPSMTGRRCRRALISKLHAQTTPVMCSSNGKRLSRVALALNGTITSETVMPLNLSNLETCWRVPMAMASVLLTLRSKLFLMCHPVPLQHMTIARRELMRTGTGWQCITVCHLWTDDMRCRSYQTHSLHSKSNIFIYKTH